jgi:hypothetical protein
MRMSRVAAALVAGGLALGTCVPAQAQPTAKRYTLRIVAVDRFGNRVTTYPGVLSGYNQPISFGSQVVKVRPGHYLVGSAVETPATGSAQLSYTLVAKLVTVSRNTTVTLDARAGRLLTVAFNATGAQQVVQGAVLCDGIGAGAMLGGVYNDPIGTTYVAPVPKEVRLFYQSRWQSSAGTLYDLAGVAATGSKAAPHFRDSLSRLAKVAIQLRSGTNAAGSGYLALTAGASCAPGGDLLPEAAPWSGTDYLQAGTWDAEVGVGARTLSWDGRLRARHSYTLDLGAAVYGPWRPLMTGTLFPVIDGNRFSYNPYDYFSDPVAQASSDCAAKVKATLMRGARVLRRLSAGAGVCAQGELTKNLPKSGWYRLDVTGTQSGGVLSSRVTVNWKFHVTIGPVRFWNRALPVVLTEFRPGGLSLENAAPPDGVTPLRVQIVKGAYPSSATPRNILKLVRIEASFDGGQTWQSLALSRRAKYWTADIDDPASGFVSLRSLVVNTDGDSSVQTMYDAYAIG